VSGIYGDGYPVLLVSAHTAGSALASSTTATSLLPGQAKFSLPANFIDVPGKTFRVRATGRVSTLVTTPGTLTLSMRLNSTPIIVSTSQAMALNIVSKSSVSWVLDLDLIVRSVGSSTSATIMGMGTWTSEAVIGAAVPSAGGSGVHQWQASSPAAGTGFDSTATNLVDLYGTWSVNSASNSITCETYCLYSMN